MPHPIKTTVLSNGLRVMFKEIHTAPIISNWLWYRVGSRDEVPGKTGISHWVEHMQFKGTPQFPANVLDKTISRVGGVWNAFTYLDWTTYYETMPSGEIDLALRLEADRMRNSIFDAKEFDSERTVVISERMGSENEPMFLLGEAVQAASFRVHPYHHEIIGDMADLKTMERQDLFNHYQHYYIPNNAVLVLSGDFDNEKILKRIEDLFGGITPGDAPKRLTRDEPDQNGEHRLTVEGPGDTTFIQAAYHSPSASHQDFFSLLVLDSLLTGPSGLNMFGGGISNKTSRLYKKMIDTEVAVSVSGGLPATIDPFVYAITIIVHPNASASDAIKVMDDEIKRIQDTAPSIDEVARAVKQARALFAYGSESITNQAFWMGFSEMFDSYEWFSGYLSHIEKITPSDVQNAAQKYLASRNRVLGSYMPTGNNQEQSA